MRKAATKQLLSFKVPSVKMILMLRSAVIRHTVACYKYTQTPGKSGDAAKSFVLQVHLKYRHVYIYIYIYIYIYNVIFVCDVMITELRNGSILYSFRKFIIRCWWQSHF